MELEVGGEARTVEGTPLLAATGRCPNTEALGLEAIGATVGPEGVLQVAVRSGRGEAGAGAR